MSKYQTYQQLFVNDGQRYRHDADRCFDTIDDLTQQLIAYSGWFSDDVEYIPLAQPILAAKPNTMLRYNRIGKNRERIRDVATLIEGWWCLGIRFRLKPHTLVSFQPAEVLFVLPLMVQKVRAGGRSIHQSDDRPVDLDVAIKLEPGGRTYHPDSFSALIELTFQRIEALLQHGIQALISESEQREVFQLLGFVLDRAHLQALHIDPPGD
jgi:hypothetical protein